VKGEGLAFAKISVIDLDFLILGVGYGGGRLMFLLDAEAGNVGATMTRYWVWWSAWESPRGMKVWVVKGCRSKIWTSNSCLLSPSLSSSKSMSPQLDGMLSDGSLGLSSRGAFTQNVQISIVPPDQYSSCSNAKCSIY